MSEHRPARNAIVAILGTPDRTEGSLDDPREREEDGVRFNEKWIYTHLRRDPAGAAMRTVYWMRYDFCGTVVRNGDGEHWRADATLVEAAAKRDGRLPPLDPARNPPLEPSTGYRPVSEFTDKSGLGGGTQEKQPEPAEKES
jgi:hypothetical protein